MVGDLFPYPKSPKKLALFCSGIIIMSISNFSVVDSSGKFPDGAMLGNISPMGSMNECMDVEASFLDLEPFRSVSQIFPHFKVTT